MTNNPSPHRLIKLPGKLQGKLQELLLGHFKDNFKENINDNYREIFRDILRDIYKQNSTLITTIGITSMNEWKKKLGSKNFWV